MKTNKKILAALAALLILPAALSAQGHLTFERIPMTGNIDSFAHKLAHQGWRLNSSYTTSGKAVAKLTAKKGNDQLEAVVETNAERKVNLITINHPVRSNWEKLMNDYNETKTDMEKRYGDQRDCADGFSGDPKKPFRALSDGLAQYRTVYVDDHGIITVTIIPERKGAARVIETYQDNPWGKPEL